MMRRVYPINSLQSLQTPFYYYDVELLKDTLDCVNNEAKKYDNFFVHYAIKANANPALLKIISKAGLGADCVSGGEINIACQTGFSPADIVFAGVGKSDWEINLALDKDIFCFNVESLAELEVINMLAKDKNKVARVALRVNPDVDAHTHTNITTGLAENKFGISLSDIDDVVRTSMELDNIEFIGLHFHIGSQILDMSVFRTLCERINDIVSCFENVGITIPNINVGGGLGIDYDNPEINTIPDFRTYFKTYANFLKVSPKQKIHFELGRAIVGQCGTLITKTLYIKKGTNKQFLIVDAGMTDLIRPALYQAFHKIENISSTKPNELYDVVGPICESSDVFGKNISLKGTMRNDLIAIKSAGAYGEIMASQYNCRSLPKGYLSCDLI